MEMGYANTANARQTVFSLLFLDFLNFLINHNFIYRGSTNDETVTQWGLEKEVLTLYAGGLFVAIVFLECFTVLMCSAFYFFSNGIVFWNDGENVWNRKSPW